MRLIDADALSDASCSGGVCAECDDMYGGNNVVTNCSEVRFRFLKLIENAPTIAPERKTGRWIEESDDYGGVYWRCSECRATYTMIDGLPSDEKYKHCPNCGAYMRGEQDGKNT